MAADPVVKTRISFPAERPGEVRIRAYLGGNLRGPLLIVGAAVWNGRTWDYTLWSRPGQHTEGDEADSVPTLKALRPLLEKRGEWWQ